MPSWQSTSRIGCPIDNPARRSRGAAPSTRPQWTRVPLDFRPRWRYVVNKAGAANAAPALKYKFYFTPHFCGYTEFGIVPNHQLSWLSACPDTRSLCPIFPRFSIPHHSFFPFTNEKAQLSLDFFDRLGHPKGCPFFISAGHVQPTLLLPCSYLGYSTGTSICRMHGSGRFTPHPQACQPCIPSHEEDRQNMSSTR